MKRRVFSFVLALACGVFFTTANAAVVFRPGEKAKYVPPGEEQLNGNAAELFDIGQKAEKDDNPKRAIRAYRQLVRKYPKDALAGGAAFRAATLLEKTREFLEAATVYRVVVVNYPTSPHFNEAIEGQFRIGELYLAGKKLKLLGIPLATSMDRAVDIFASIIRTAPYGKYTARAQFDIGLAREKQGANDAAIQAYQAVIDKFPTDPVASDAQYQIGYIWWSASKAGTRDIAATNNARIAFQDYLFRYPNSEKSAQARANLQQLEHKSINTSFEVARFYDKQKAYRAAVIYYNEVIRQQPGSAESEKAKKRIEQLRAKVGDKVLQSAQEPDKKAGDQQKPKTQPPPTAEKPPAPDSEPVLPPDLDTSLPPSPGSSSSSSSSSLSPDTSGSSTSTSPEPTNSATPEPSTAPAQTPATAPETTPEESPASRLREDTGSLDPTASPTP
ncbi:MAG TPA: outer membrane protein assembly factor BamD [Chthoniobacterales bacterium]|nr:outer membrane protein assembly factor BamD [Chthoniobacterales bacterium]